jgi:hydroxymethylbilane synthase
MQVLLMTRVLTVATRAGALAIAQTQSIITALKKIHPDLQIKIKKITAEGDRDRRTALWKLKTTGFFTSKLEDALLARQADFAVHSFKDLPTRQQQGLTVAAVCQRQFVEDCLLAGSSITSIEQLQPSAKIGTSSPRRIALLRHLRPDLEPTDIRGNVTTRLRKLQQAKFDAVILARAGIQRLGLADNIAFCFDPKEFIPAAAQGALAVQTRADDSETAELIAAIDDQNDHTTCDAERRVLSTMQCGCHAPAGAFAEIIRGDIIIRAFISNLQGTNFIKREITGPAADADKLAEEVAHELFDAGGRDILKGLER